MRLDAFEAFTRLYRGAQVLFNSRRAAPEALKGLPPIYELAWNHTTLRALRVDPTITYLQARYPAEGALASIKRIPRPLQLRGDRSSRADPLQWPHWLRGTPLVRFSSEERLQEIIAEHEAMGAMIFNPHRYTLEEGGMKQTDATQLAFKRETDPQGLLNPGKMIAWEDPDFDYSGQEELSLPRPRGARARRADISRSVRVLVLFAHPVEMSFGAALHSKVIKVSRAHGHDFDDCDLRAEGFDPAHIRSARRRQICRGVDRRGRCGPEQQRFLSFRLVPVFEGWGQRRGGVAAVAVRLDEARRVVRHRQWLRIRDVAHHHHGRVGHLFFFHQRPQCWRRSSPTAGRSRATRRGRESVAHTCHARRCGSW